jgi:hypothetical protein
MVEIRTLQPIVKLRIPTARTNIGRPSRVMVVRRTQATHPSPTPQPTPCRLWQGAQGSDGYGWRKTDIDGSRKGVSMHRWVMAEYLGRKLKPTEVVLHACDNPLCYRIDHLSLGTIADNNADMKAKGRAHRPPVNVFHGECHPMAKLTESQVREIRGHRQSGLYVRTIAQMYDVAPSTIRRICAGVTWNTVGDERSYAPPIKPPTRDLMAEARARIEAAERSISAEAGGGSPSASAEIERKPRVKPVKHLNVTTRRNDDIDP